MITRVYKLYSNAASTTNAAAQLIIQQSGLITGVVFTGYSVGDAGGSVIDNELSFSSTGQQQTSDTVGPIAMHTKEVAFTAAGSCVRSQQLTVTNLAIPVQSGDRLYLNVYNPDNQPQTETCFIYVLQK